MRCMYWYDKKTSQLRSDVLPEELTGLLKNPHGLLWADLAQPTEEDLSLLTTVFGFSPLTVEDCQHPQLIPKLEMHKKFIFMVMHGVKVNQKSGLPDSGRVETKELDMFIGKNFLVTVHDKELLAVTQAHHSIKENPTQLEEGSVMLAYHILDTLVDLYLPVMNMLDERLSELEQTVRLSSRQDMTEAFFDLHHALANLQRATRKQEEVLLGLTRKEHPLITEEDVVCFQDIHDHLVRLLELTQTCRDNLNWILDTHLALVSHRTNDIMRILTIYNMVLLPLGFITSFYGMNFDQPETHWAFGYPFVILVMLATLFAVWVYFRRKEWV